MIMYEIGDILEEEGYNVEDFSEEELETLQEEFEEESYDYLNDYIESHQEYLANIFAQRIGAKKTAKNNHVSHSSDESSGVHDEANVNTK